MVQIYYLGLWKCTCEAALPVLPCHQVGSTTLASVNGDGQANMVVDQPNAQASANPADIQGDLRPITYCLNCGCQPRGLIPRRRRRAFFLLGVLVATVALLLIGLITNAGDRPTLFLGLAILICKLAAMLAFVGHSWLVCLQPFLPCLLACLRCLLAAILALLTCLQPRPPTFPTL